MNMKWYAMVILSVIGFTVFAFDQESNTVIKLTIPQDNAEFRSFGATDLRNELVKNIALIGSGHENRAVIRKLRVELARRGDKEERDKLFSALKSPILAEQADALEDVAQLADREAVYHLAEMLSDPNPGGRITYVTQDGGIAKSGDCAVSPPRIAAALKLATLIEDPPVPPIGADKKFYTEEDVLTWRRWWETNKANFLAVQ
ncbi:MAG TPA: hypothetical protein P5169_03030 [Kiritimatiellia bacterium]|jgi:HEAT repeat protein|nr:hypothetical protein [Kiritimatiellia bacterium]